MIDHVTLNVGDYDRSKAFYEEALKPLGYALQMEFGSSGGFGAERMPGFWIRGGEEPGVAHVAFQSPDRATVDAFHQAAIAAGGSDNGAPGLRPYHDSYYAAFVHDPDGNNVEAVCHAQEGNN
jgi:catechol 2,3-dioxygenase-like lactoylglutathione lyase family enzyme